MIVKESEKAISASPPSGARKAAQMRGQMIRQTLILAMNDGRTRVGSVR